VFVEKNPKACTCIRENLSFTKLTDGGKLLNMDVLQALRSLEGGEPFVCIFLVGQYVDLPPQRSACFHLQECCQPDTQGLVVPDAVRMVHPIKIQYKWFSAFQ